MWCHLLTLFNRRYLLRFAAILTLFIALFTTLIFSVISHAAEGTNQVIGFQGRLMTSTGDVVPDGYYNIQFKIYEGGTGLLANNPGGTLKWTESYINNGNAEGGVQVEDGLLSVNLGSRTPFGNSINWDEENLWLSMNVAGNNISCTTFGTAPCAADGEMLPMKRMTASPYAMNAGAVNGKTADNFIQLAQGVQTDASTNTSSIFINKTGSGNLIQLQNTATDVFTIKNTGDLALGSNADKTISIDTSPPDTGGRQLSVIAGGGGTGTGSSGGTLSLQGGAGGGTNGNGGDVSIDAGTKTGTGNDGAISIGTASASSITIGSTTNALNQTINIGANNTAGSSSEVVIGSGGSATSGTTTVQAKNAITIATNGTTRATFSDSTNTVYFGNGVSAAAPNDYTLQGTNSSATAVAGGSLNIQGGSATTGDANGGDVTLAGGAGSGTGTSGLVVLTTPTFSTVTNDANCYTSGAAVALSCTVSQSSVNNSSAVLVGFSAVGQTASLPDPTNTTAGRILYVMAANDSENFTLSMNGGGAGNEIIMRKNATSTIMWNGSDWTVAGTSSATALKDTYNSDSGALNIQIGDGVDDGIVTLLTVDKSASAPTVTDEALLGSMYYDTTAGKVQCYEAEGWGDCGSSPDSFVSLSPTYSGAVVNGIGIGNLTTDICSDELDLNDGSAIEQPAICGTDETYNFYKWTTDETSIQNRSVYVTYQLPGTFKEFVEDSTSLMGRTDSLNSNVSYQVYRNNSQTGLTACGLTTDVSTGAKSTWQKALAETDPASCGFVAGDSIVFKINLSAHTDASAYISNLGFAFSNN